MWPCEQEPAVGEKGGVWVEVCRVFLCWCHWACVYIGESSLLFRNVAAATTRARPQKVVGHSWCLEGSAAGEQSPRVHVWMLGWSHVTGALDSSPLPCVSSSKLETQVAATWRAFFHSLSHVCVPQDTETAADHINRRVTIIRLNIRFRDHRTRLYRL